MTKISTIFKVYDDPFANTCPVTAAQWNALAGTAQPFMRHEYLAALHHSASATARTGWAAHMATVWAGDALQAACMVYIKPHSYGEYVFDFAWADAYARHGLDYYPKAVVAVPFTPVPGPRLLAHNEDARAVLLQSLVTWCEEKPLSSLHILFAPSSDAPSLMQRQTVQFHWQNADYQDFDHFLSHLSQDKRKKIRQERRKVADAGVTFRHSTNISAADWDFFYRCYERTYLEHGNAPYLTRDFFQRMADTLPEHWLLFIAEREGNPIACSLIAIGGGIAYGRYWGALERVDCLHFEACYYQPLQWCIANGYQRFEGGAQGEHKMARALLPVTTHSAHWLAHPGFADAVQLYLEREGAGMENYLMQLAERTPLKLFAADQTAV